MSDIKTRGVYFSWDKSSGGLNCRLGGVRCKGDVILNQALVRNMGTCRSDAEAEASAEVRKQPVDTGETQVAETTRVRVPKRSTGTERSVVAMKSAKADGAKGPRYRVLFSGQL